MHNKKKEELFRRVFLVRLDPGVSLLVTLQVGVALEGGRAARQWAHERTVSCVNIWII